MATAAEIREGLEDYQRRCNDNPKLRKMLRAWTRRIHFTATDAPVTFSVLIELGELTTITEGAEGTPDLVIAVTSEDLADMFWGDLNPAAKYLTGDIKVQGAQEDVMRVDAMASIIWVDA